MVSLAVLSDGNRAFRPVSYSDGRWGCRLLFEFPMVKLLDYVEPARQAARAALRARLRWPAGQACQKRSKPGVDPGTTLRGGALGARTHSDGSSDGSSNGS